MADVKTVRVEFKGEGSESLVAQYDAVIKKQKELEKEIETAAKSGGTATDSMDKLNESLDGFSRRGPIASGISRGLALGLGALGSLATQAVIEGISWAVDQLSESTERGQGYLDKFKGKAEEMATALLSVENAAGLAITRLNRYNSLRAGDSLAEAAKIQQQKILNEASRFSGGPSSKMGPTGGSNPAVAAVLNQAGTATNVDAAMLKAWREEIEKAGAASKEMRDKLEPARMALIEWQAAVEGTTPKITGLTEVTGALEAKQARQAELLQMTADKAAVAKTWDDAYRDAKEKLSKVTDITIEQIDTEAKRLADLAAANKQVEIDIRNRAKAEKDAAAARKERAKDDAEEQRRLERFYDGVEKAIRRAEKAEDAAAKKRAERQKDFDAYVASIRLEAEVLGLSNEQRELRLALAEAESRLGPNSPGLTPTQRQDVTDAVQALQRAELAKKEAEEYRQVWSGAYEDVRVAEKDFLYGLGEDGKFHFKRFATELKNIWWRTLVDMTLLSKENSLVAPLFQAMFGMAAPGATGGGASPFGGGAGTVDIFSTLFGKGSPKLGPATVQDAMDGGLSTTNNGGGGFVTGGGGGLLGKAGGLLGGAMMGYGVGSMAGSGIGGAVGGAIGSAIGGPIGSIVGGVLGGLVGSLFKSTPKSISSYGTDGITGSMAQGLDVKIGKDMANGVIRALQTFADELATGLESDKFLGIVGQRGKKFFYQAQETDLKVAGKKKYGAVKFDSAEEAIAAAIEAAINSGVVQGLTDSDKKLMRAATSVEQAMQDVVASHDFKRELDFQYTGLSSPLAEAQARLEFEYQEQLKLAEKYEADKTKVEAIYAAKRAALQKEYNEQLYGGLKDYLVALTGGSASPLSPANKLNLAQARYNDLATKAKAGDKDAIAALQGAASDYLSAGQSVFASSDGYFSIYNRVVGDISGITGVANPLAAANTNVAAAVNDNSRLQAAAAAQAASQRATIIAQNAELIAQNAALVAALQRLGSTATQQGVVGVGSVTWPNLAAGW